MRKLLIPAVIVLLVLLSGCTQKACTEEAKICPDGTAVGRTGPNCEFAPCPTECEEDSDCVLFGETGDCNCGCYNKDNLPKDTGGECFCQAPTSCDCINGICEGIFAEISKEEAIQIAENTEDCSGYLTDFIMYNSNTYTWWIDLSLEKEGCAPACVVSEDKTAEINWRCTGLIE